MKTSSLAFGLLLICGVGCGDDGTGGEGGTASSSSSSATTSGSSKASSGSTTSGTASTGTASTSGSSSASGTGSSATTAASTTAASSSSAGGNAMLSGSVDSGDFFANCMPAIPPDPLNGSVVVTFDNTGSDPGTVEITSVDIAYANGLQSATWTFEVLPAVVTVNANSSYQVTFDKVAGSGMNTSGMGGPCSFCGGNGNATATITVHALYDGVAADPSLSLGQPQCAF